MNSDVKGAAPVKMDPRSREFLSLVNTKCMTTNVQDNSGLTCATFLKECLENGDITKCENYVELFEKKKWSAYCNGCGCPIDKKIFSGKINPCPLEKWDEIDKKYNTYIGIKHKKTIL